MMNQPRIFVVIPVHNRIDYTRACLRSLGKQTVRDLRVVIVDDGSTDETAGGLASDFPQVTVLRGDGNLWWAGAMNMGLEWCLDHVSDNDYILTLNNDTTVGPDYLKSLLLSAATRPGTLIGSVIVSDEDRSTIVDGGVLVNWLTAKHKVLAVGEPVQRLGESEDFLQVVDVLPGRGTLIPAAVIRAIGVYDSKRLPHYGADYEFSHRARRLGYALLISYRAIVYSSVRSTGINNRIQKIPWPAFLESYFSIRSSYNLRYRWNFAKLCCPKTTLPIFYLMDTTRVVLGGIRHQLRNQFS